MNPVPSFSNMGTKTLVEETAGREGYFYAVAFLIRLIALLGTLCF